MSERLDNDGTDVFDGPVSDAVADALKLLAQGVEAVRGLNLSVLSIAELRAVEQAIQVQLGPLVHAQRLAFAELDQRGVLTSLKLRRVSDLIGVELRCSRRVARAHEQAIGRFGPRRRMTGEPLGPALPITADALGSGVINDEQADVIATAVESLPEKVRAERGTEVETTLVELARAKEPRALKQLAERIIAHLDPDGPEPEEIEQRQHSRRRLVLFPHPDGSAIVEGQLTPACFEVWRAILASLAKQKPADGDAASGDGSDTRTDAQRTHDAFEEAGRRLLAAKNLPSTASLATTMIIRIDLKDLENRIGKATTHHGGTITVNEALRLGANGELIPAVFGDSSEILTVGRKQRLATKGQRRALFARDRGCTFPDCPKTAAESEIHHATEWIHGGETNVNSMAVVCGYHNNEAPRMGWQTLMINGIPHWKPPRWRDPEQRLQRNYLHHPELVKRDLVPDAPPVEPGRDPDGATNPDHVTTHRPMAPGAQPSSGTGGHQLARHLARTRSARSTKKVQT